MLFVEFIMRSLFFTCHDLGALQKSDVNAVMIGTTHFINAVVQRSVSLEQPESLSVI